VDRAAQGIFGHSMGGHGALVCALRNPERYRSVSAFAPISSPMHCPWGEKAFGGYLGSQRAAWRTWDATALIEDGHRVPDMLVDQGLADTFLASQLMPERLEQACSMAGQPLTLRRHPGYDHSYFFIATFVADHLEWHAARRRQRRRPECPNCSWCRGPRGGPGWAAQGRRPRGAALVEFVAVLAQRRDARGRRRAQAAAHRGWGLPT
jgi:pimeloyl-ACP methyl ester carboxylesterase